MIQFRPLLPASKSRNELAPIVDTSHEGQMFSPPLPDIFAFLERAGIREFDGGEDRRSAENSAARDFGFASADQMRREYFKQWGAL